jgi:hypothetical protein
MGISIEHYRARIGIHTINCMRMKNNYLRYYLITIATSMSAHINLRAVACNTILI